MRPDIDLRSYLDTRGAAIVLALSLLGIVGFAALGGLLQPLALPEATSDVELTVIALTLPLGLILPVVAVLMTAGEWSDRSIQVTLLQRPGRTAVLASKTIAALVVIAVLIAVSLALAAAATWVGGEVLGEGATFDSLDGVMTTQLSTLAATVLFSLAMGIVMQSTVIGLVAAIGIPFVVTTASTVATAMGAEVVTDIVRAVDLQAGAIALGNGDAGAFELIPLVLLVILPAVLGAWRWNRREVG